jgi:phosphohistidine phosphatase
MARVTLIRHGKAEMPRIGEEDFARGLVQRGVQNSEDIGAFMLAHKMLPDRTLVSPAARTRQTYELMSSSWPDESQALYLDALYEVSADTLLRLIFDHAGDVENVAVVGHNPSLVILLSHFVGLDGGDMNLGYFPTCCVADVGFDAARVADIDPEAGRLLSLVRARDLSPLM